MNSTVVESSTLAALAYDDVRQVLQLEFRSGVFYRYYEVPAPVYEALLKAPSKGGYFNRAIRGKFPHARALNGAADFHGVV